MDGFVVNVDEGLSREERLALVRAIAELQGVKAIHSLPMLLRALDKTMTERLAQNWHDLIAGEVGLSYRHWSN